MKNKIKLFAIIVFAALIAFSMTACGEDGGGSDNNNNNGGGGALKLLDVTINRTGSSNTQFLYSVAPIAGATHYADNFDSFNIGTMTGTASAANVSSLPAKNPVMGVQAKKGAGNTENASLATDFPALVKYTGSNTGAQGLNDLIKLLYNAQGSRNSIGGAFKTEYEAVANLSTRNNISSIYDGDTPVNTDSNASTWKTSTPQWEAAFKVVAKHLPTIMTFLSNPYYATEYNEALEALYKVWFNIDTVNAGGGADAADAKTNLDNYIKSKYPGVKTIS